MLSTFQLGLGLVCVFVAYCDQTDDEATATAYLAKYGYVGEKLPDPKMAFLSNRDALPMAIRNFQVMSGLEVTGVLDKATIAKMKQPRCGVPDIMTMEDKWMDTRKRKKRYALQGGVWPRTQLTYRIRNYTLDMKQADVDKEIRRAFDVWEMVTPLRFTENPNKPDIDILFASGKHCNSDPFDGTGKALAHAFFPKYGGDAHFDESELWTLNTENVTLTAVKLFNVAAHQFGHSLGLGHSTVKEALMYPLYNPNFVIHKDDVDGIQKLYGKPRTQGLSTRSTGLGTTRRPVSSTTRYRRKVCSEGRFDTITKHTENDNQKVYAFVNDLYMEIRDGAIVPGYPRTISQDWVGLPDNLDTAIYYKAENNISYSWKDLRFHIQQTAPERTYFFKGVQYWRFENKKMMPGYPRSVFKDWGGLPGNMDASFEWSSNGRKYFVKGDRYYRVNSGKMHVDRYYPRDLTVWDKTLRRLDSALQIDGSTYFFVGNQYYKYDDSAFALNKTDYPRSIAKDWMGCDKFLEIVNKNTHDDDNINSAPGAGYNDLSLILSTFIASIVLM